MPANGIEQDEQDESDDDPYLGRIITLGTVYTKNGDKPATWIIAEKLDDTVYAIQATVPVAMMGFNDMDYSGPYRIFKDVYSISQTRSEAGKSYELFTQIRDVQAKGGRSDISGQYDPGLQQDNFYLIPLSLKSSAKSLSVLDAIEKNDLSNNYYAKGLFLASGAYEKGYTQKEPSAGYASWSPSAVYTGEFAAYKNGFAATRIVNGLKPSLIIGPTYSSGYYMNEFAPAFNLDISKVNIADDGTTTIK